ncbi:hypothetical protein FNF27_01731 [Cafeteria roenbergensis]|uniref:Uncharacterized protein n=1 Tax=Cafeteria roenbergensis TaxID=33653 RepID=A0A5A8EH41_CAFRO|nr:hypothetical protein FNF27_01731 [Cafeteria roenbergensis]
MQLGGASALGSSRFSAAGTQSRSTPQPASEHIAAVDTVTPHPASSPSDAFRASMARLRSISSAEAALSGLARFHGPEESDRDEERADGAAASGPGARWTQMGDDQDDEVVFRDVGAILRGAAPGTASERAAAVGASSGFENVRQRLSSIGRR